jgi:hypothetical protein
MLDTDIVTVTNAVRVFAAQLDASLEALGDVVDLTNRHERSIIITRKRLAALYRTLASIERDTFTEN